MIEGVGIIFTQVAMRRQMEFMKEMQAQEMARQKAMMTVGGENPWEVGVNKDVV